MNNIRLHETPEYRGDLFLNWPKKGIQLIFRNFPVFIHPGHTATQVSNLVLFKQIQDVSTVQRTS